MGGPVVANGAAPAAKPSAQLPVIASFLDRAGLAKAAAAVRAEAKTYKDGAVRAARPCKPCKPWGAVRALSLCRNR